MKMSWKKFLIENFYKRVRKGTRILEIGTGALSNLEALLASTAWRAIVWTLDPNKDSLEKAKKVFQKHVEKGFLKPIQGYAEKLPFGDATFDMVVSTMTFHHLNDTKKGVQECYRVLKKGGELIILDWNASGSLFTPHTPEHLEKAKEIVINSIKELKGEEFGYHEEDEWYVIWIKK